MYRLITDRRKAVKRWRKANPEKRAEQRKRWRKRHPEYLKDWRKAHPERVRIYRERARRKK